MDDRRLRAERQACNLAERQPDGCLTRIDVELAQVSYGFALTVLHQLHNRNVLASLSQISDRCSDDAGVHRQGDIVARHAGKTRAILIDLEVRSNRVMAPAVP